MGNSTQSINPYHTVDQIQHPWFSRMDPGDKYIVDINIVNSPAWYARTLWEEAKNRKVEIFTVKEVIKLYDDSDHVFKEYDERNIRIANEDVDLSFPIIVTRKTTEHDPVIVDGFHRVYKARHTKQTLPYVMLDVMPAPDLLNNHHTPEAIERIQCRTSLTCK